MVYMLLTLEVTRFDFLLHLNRSVPFTRRCRRRYCLLHTPQRRIFIVALFKVAPVIVALFKVAPVIVALFKVAPVIVALFKVAPVIVALFQSGTWKYYVET